MNTGGSNMLATELRSFISPMVRAVVSTGAVTEARITRDYGRKDEAFQRWKALIDDQLIEWGRDPSQLEDEETQPPSKEIIGLAILPSAERRIDSNRFPSWRSKTIPPSASATIRVGAG